MYFNVINSKSNMKILLKTITLVFFAWLLICFVWFRVPASNHYHVKETYSFQSNNKVAAANVRLTIMLPKSGPYQTVKNLINISLSTLDYFYPAILSVIEANENPKDAVHRLMQELEEAS